MPTNTIPVAESSVGGSPPRRDVSHETLSDLAQKVQELEDYRSVVGDYDVPRGPEHADLGEWLAKLRRTYVRCPDGQRVRWVSIHAPALHAHLVHWRTTSSTRPPVRNVPFWVSAGWAYEFMTINARAPAQSSTDPAEVVHAKWLTRWSDPFAVTQLAKHPLRQQVATALATVAARMRSASSNSAHLAHPPEIGALMLSAYEALAGLASQDATDCPDDTIRVSPSLLRSVSAQGGPFWPTWHDWRAHRPRQANQRDPRWPNPGDADASHQRAASRSRLDAILDRKPAAPSPLAALCERFGVPHCNLWVLLRKPARQPHKVMYFRVDTLTDSTVSLVRPRGYSKRLQFWISVDTFQRLLQAHQYKVSRTVPLVDSDLPVVCARLGVSSATVQIEIANRRYVPQFVLGEQVELTTGVRKERATTRVSLPEFERAIIDGTALALPRIVCSNWRSTVRYPVATDRDLQPLLDRIAIEGPVRGRVRRSELAAAPPGGGCTIKLAWQQLAVLSVALAAPDYGKALQRNLDLVLCAEDPGVRHLAAILLYLSTVDRSSPLSRPVLASISRGGPGPLPHGMFSSWQAGNAILGRFWKLGAKLKLGSVFV